MQLYINGCISRSREGAWIEIWIDKGYLVLFKVAPVRERGLKLRMLPILKTLHCRRSREGAWIEIKTDYIVIRQNRVAPVRERGLKLQLS